MGQTFIQRIYGIWARLSHHDVCLRTASRSLRPAMLLGGALLLMALAPRAGTIIPNKASVSYLNPTTGVRQTFDSNLVNVVILPQEALTLTPDHNVLRAPGTQVVLSHRLTNTGNAPTTYVLRYANLSADDYDFTNLRVVHDRNTNGTIDPGEPDIPLHGTVSLPAGAFLDLLLIGLVPGTTPSGKHGMMTISAMSQLQGVTVLNTDTVTTAGAVIEVRKSASTLTPQRRENVTFTLIGQNTGGAAATATPITVNGAATSLVILRDIIPANTTFVRAEPTDGRWLYHQISAPLHTYTSTPPANLTQVDAVALGYPSFAVGQQSTMRFTVSINANASGPVTNTGTMAYTDGSDAKTKDSNTVQLAVPTVPPTIAYYSSDSFATVTPLLHLGDPLFVQADAAACNHSPTTVETRVIVLLSTLTGDVESFTATESAPNSGIFRILPAPLTMDATRQPPQSGNGQVETIPNDTLTARLEGCGATEVHTTILVDPFGVVFDSKTNALVAGAKVTLIDVTGAGNGGNPGGPAQVFTLSRAGTTPNAARRTTTDALADLNLIPAPSTVTTVADGKFTFPLVRSSTYRLQVEPPADYIFPSVLPPTSLPPNRVIEPSGSYGQTFKVAAITGPVRLDVPVDRSATGGLLIDKKPSRNVVELGDFVDYTVKIRNTRDAAVTGVRLTDRLPAGFVLQKRTARLDKQPHPDPEGAPGPTLAFAIGSIPANGTVTLTYRVKVGPGALQGDGINRALAESPPPLPQSSNIATAKVEVRGGVFSDKGFIIGKVFLDCNRNRVQDQEEIGIPGVRLYLEDGTFVITDVAGKFSFAGITPRTHVLKLDKTTMPPGSTLVPLANRNAGSPDSRFVDLKNQELHKADFAEGSCSQSVRDDVQARRTKATAFIAETEKGLATELRPEDAPRTEDVRSLPASGLVHRKDNVPHFSPVITPSSRNDQTTSLPAAPVQAAPSIPLAELLPTLDNQLGFIDLKDGDTLPYTQATVRVKGLAGSALHLIVNGDEVPASRVGSKNTLAIQQSEAWEYIGVDLKPGSNTLEVSQRDSFGNARGRQSITVIAPDKLGVLKIAVDTPRPVADGRTPVNVIVQLTDTHGVPVTVRTPVTLEASRGQWQEPDLDPHEPGLQIFITDGKGTAALLPPAEAGDVVLRVTSGILRAENIVPFFPDLRPLIAAGVVEGILNVHKLNTSALLPARQQDGFERELRELSASANNGKIRGGGRAALFLKGKIKGDVLLTMAYDSDKDTKERLFRDIQPDEFYPVYGDSSIHGFDAQSTGRLYVRVDKEKSYLLYGDFTTETRNQASNLGHYSRSLTGGKAHYEDQRLSVNAFASRDNTTQVIDEIRGRGISGPYTLSRTNMVENSEKVEILVRDRQQPSVVLTSTPQSRFSDYEIDALGGTILFKVPVRSVDANLNPVSIRVIYEVDQGGKDFWVYGVDAQVKVTNFFQLGGTYVRDENPQDRLEIASLNALVKLSDHTYMLAEVARTDGDSKGAGMGWRAELVHDGERFKIRVYVGRTDKSFDNPTALLGQGRFEAAAKAAYTLTERTKLLGEVVHSEDRQTGGRRDGGELAVAHNFGKGIFGELGVRHARETGQPADRPEDSVTPFETTSVRAKLGVQMPFLPQLTMFAEYEQDVLHLDRQVVALGGEYQFLNRGRIYAKHEFISTLRGRYTLNSQQRQHNTVFGADFDYIKDGHVFSEYRLDNGISGREGQAAIGLRHRFRLTDGLMLYAGFERVQTVEGDGDDSTALSTAIEYTASPRLKVTARLEMRKGEQTDSLLNTLGVAYKLSDSWTFLGKHVLSLSNEGAQERLRLGMAYRDTDTNVWNALWRYEFTHDDKDGVRQAHILAATVNYQPVEPLLLSGSLAAKWVLDKTNGYHSTSSTYLVSTRATYDIVKNWDVGLTGSALASGNLSTVQYGLGVEVGRMITTNLWLSAGYNFFGFYDRDLSGVDYTNPGFFFRFRYKFDEELFQDAAQTVSHVFGGGKQSQ